MYKDPYREYIPQHPDLHKNFKSSGPKEGDKKKKDTETEVSPLPKLGKRNPLERLGDWWNKRSKKEILGSKRKKVLIKETNKILKQLKKKEPKWIDNRKKQLNRDIDNYFFTHKPDCGKTGHACRYSKMLDDYYQMDSETDKKKWALDQKNRVLLEELEEYNNKEGPIKRAKKYLKVDMRPIILGILNENEWNMVLANIQNMDEIKKWDPLPQEQWRYYNDWYISVMKSLGYNRDGYKKPKDFWDYLEIKENGGKKKKDEDGYEEEARERPLTSTDIDLKEVNYILETLDTELTELEKKRDELDKIYQDTESDTQEEKDAEAKVDKANGKINAWKEKKEYNELIKLKESLEQAIGEERSEYYRVHDYP